MVLYLSFLFVTFFYCILVFLLKYYDMEICAWDGVDLFFRFSGPRWLYQLQWCCAIDFIFASLTRRMIGRYVLWYLETFKVRLKFYGPMLWDLTYLVLDTWTVGWRTCYHIFLNCILSIKVVENVYGICIVFQNTIVYCLS